MKALPVICSGASSAIVSTPSWLVAALPSLVTEGVTSSLHTEFGIIDGVRQTNDNGITRPLCKMEIKLEKGSPKRKKIYSPLHLFPQHFVDLKYRILF